MIFKQSDMAAILFSRTSHGLFLHSEASGAICGRYKDVLV